MKGLKATPLPSAVAVKLEMPAGMVAVPHVPPWQVAYTQSRYRVDPEVKGLTIRVAYA